MAHKVAIVTGSNQGIGLATVKELCKRGVGVVYLTARSVERGKQAVDELKKNGYHPHFHQLEVTDKKSVKAFADHLKKNHDGIDILINNAGVSTQNFSKTTFEDSKRVVDTNYFGILNIQEYLFPLLKDDARVINISSNCGHISNLKNKYWIDRLTKDDLKLEDVNAFVDWYLESVKNDTLREEDFAEKSVIAYRISKVAVCALTRVQQKRVNRGISVNSLHPGFVRTSMTKGFGELTIEEAGIAPTYLALDIDQSAKGKYFWFDKTEKDWADSKQGLYGKTDAFLEMLEKSGQIY